MADFSSSFSSALFPKCIQSRMKTPEKYPIDVIAFDEARVKFK
jgi:hypothetical protein